MRGERKNYMAWRTVKILFRFAYDRQWYEAGFQGANKKVLSFFYFSMVIIYSYEILDLLLYILGRYRFCVFILVIDSNFIGRL